MRTDPERAHAEGLLREAWRSDGNGNGNVNE